MWSLTGKSAITYLLNRNFPLTDFLGDNFHISEKIKTNRNNIIEISGSKNSLIIKQAQNGEANLINSIINEANFYEYLKLTNFKSEINHLKFYDNVNNLLVFTRSNEHKNCTLDILKNEELLLKFSKEAANQLFKYHHHKKPKYFSKISNYRPRILNPEELNKIIFDLKSVSNIFCTYWAEYVEKNSSLLIKISKLWTYDAIIHRDVKVQNFIQKDDNFYLIDWELNALGDKYWDLADFIFNYLRQNHYFYNIEIDPGLNSYNLRLCCINFIDSYCKLLKLENDDQFYKKAMIFYVVRMLEHFIGCTINGIWDMDKIFLESYRLNKYIHIVENFDSSEFDFKYAIYD